MDGCPLGLGLVVEDKPTEFSCTSYGTCTCMLIIWLVECVHTITWERHAKGQITCEWPHHNWHKSVLCVCVCVCALSFIRNYGHSNRINACMTPR